jgi:signal transduction histidine kinase
MRAETAVQSRLVEAMRAYSDRELITAGATFLGLPVVAALVVFLLRDRIFSSLDGVNRLLERLSRRDYSPASVEHVGPELKRVIESYNALVTRLAAAEAETAERRQKLESQVRSATSTVLRQQQEMAAANRLAAIGETSARIAHELRNPLAGIELALANISRDLEQTPGSETTELLTRLDPVIGELQRMSRLLTEQLEGTRRAPERPVPFELSTFLAETVALIRYQTPENIALDVDVPEPVRCRLPRDMLRQTVFNLALNAVRAIDDGCGRVVFRAVRRDGTLDLDIEDNGPGFPEDLLATGPRLFVSGRPTGTGIGLATARRMTQGMGGDLALANRREGGAVVRLTLPCGAPDA